MRIYITGRGRRILEITFIVAGPVLIATGTIFRVPAPLIWILIWIGALLALTALFQSYRKMEEDGKYIVFT